MLKFRSTRRSVPLTCALIASSVLGGCTQTVATPGEAVAETHDALYQAGVPWPANRVNVCIDSVDNGGTKAATFKQMAQDELKASWGKYTAVQFVGLSGGDWGTCPDLTTPLEYGNNFTVVALHFCTKTSTSPFCAATKPNPTKGLPPIFIHYAGGSQAAGNFASFTTNGSPTDQTGHHAGWAPPVPFNEPYNVVAYTPGVVSMGLLGDDQDFVFQTRFRYNVIHEFGHALGFVHEQDRADNNGQCSTPGLLVTPSEVAPQYVNTWNPWTVDPRYAANTIDANSIMNYCAKDQLQSADTTNQNPVLLSGVDIYGARQLYSRTSTSHGFMIQSDGNSALAVNAANGARDGGNLVLTSACNDMNPDCTWSYQRGMLVSDSDPRLAIVRETDASGKYVLRLRSAAIAQDARGTYKCTPANDQCTWTYSKGQFLLDADNQTYALNARGGVVDGANVGLGVVGTGNGTCNTSNNSCMWTLPDVMLTTDRDAALPINAHGGAIDHAVLVTNRLCDTTNNSCTFKFTRGTIQTTGNTRFWWNAYGGANAGNTVLINGNCKESNTSCTWTWSHGRIKSDDETNGKFYVGAMNQTTSDNLAAILVEPESVCALPKPYYGPPMPPGPSKINPDCIISGFSARN